jgi:Bax protein
MPQFSLQKKQSIPDKVYFYFLIISFFSFSCSPKSTQNHFLFRVYDSINNKEKITPLKEKPQNTLKKTKKMAFKEVVSAELPDFSKIKNTRQKKTAFFHFLYPIVEKENKRILEQRAFVALQYQHFKLKAKLSDQTKEILSSYFIQYRCQRSNLSDSLTYKELLNHMDIIPIDLVLVQAALESSWGSSYFARAGNNIFGQWCFTPGCGLIPRSRAKGKTHEVAKFDSLSESIRSYMLFLNSHPFFNLLRVEREKARISHQEPDGYSMAKGLTAYSARGKAYVREIQAMLRSNQDLFKP